MFFPGRERFKSEESVGVWGVRREHHKEEEHDHNVEDTASGGGRVLHRYDQHPCESLLWTVTLSSSSECCEWIQLRASGVRVRPTKRRVGQGGIREAENF